MDDDDDKDDTKRKSRNLSEKKRRDQFNLLVNELSSMVSTNTRKMDKSTVLKSTIAFLKNHNEVAVRSKVHEIQENWKPAFLPNEEFTHLILEALDGFIIVFSSSGKIHYSSESITSLLGHLPNDLLQMTIYDLVYDEEQQNIYNILLSPPKTVIEHPLQSGITPENQVSFLCHVKRGSMENPPKVSYEYVEFTGYFRDNVDVENMVPSSRFSAYSGDVDTRSLFVGIGRLKTPQLIREMSIVDTKSEFTSRHSLEWKFLFLDHRAPPIIGYLPFEVLGTSGYDYYHFDDLDLVVTCHEALMQKGEGTSCFYRFLTKGQQWIWLQTRFYITYHQWNSKPEFIVCTHRVVSYADVMKHMRKNNGSMLKDIDDNDSTMDDRRAPASTSNVMVMSPWSSKGSKASKSFTRGSPNVRLKRQASFRPDSDSNSMSADSPLSHHSMMTQNSSVSKRSRSKVMCKATSGSQHQQQHQQHSHFSQFNLPHSQTSNSSQHLQVINHQLPHSVTFQQPSPSHHMMTPTTIQRPPVGTTQAISSPYLEPPQFLSAIPVQPIFAATATVISSVQSVPEYVHSRSAVLSPAHGNQMQSNLQRKHEELQKLIVQQQDELRRVSEQLFMARYGISQPVVNISSSLPFSCVPSNQTDVGGEVNRSGVNIYQEQHPQMLQHLQVSSQNQQNPQIHIHQPSQSNHVTHQPPLIPIQYDVVNTQKNNPNEAPSTEQENDDIMQYMQHQSQAQVIPQQQQQHHQNNDGGFQQLPFELMNSQAQILFSTGNTNDNHNTSSNK